jgi:hypothetical protein
MSDYVRASLNSSKSLLHALRSRPSFNDVSSSERARVQTVLAAAPLTSEHLGEIATMVKEMGFAELDESMLLDFIGGLCIKPSGSIVQPGTSSQLQNWEAVAHYLPQNIWTELNTGNCSPAMDFLVRMGLRHPTEATARAISLVVLFGSDGFEKTNAMSPSQKLVFLHSVKQMLKDRRKTAGPPTLFISLLPAAPKQISDQNPVLFKQWYGEGGAPMASPMSDVQFSQLKGSFRLRVVRSCPYGLSQGSMSGPSTPFGMMQAGMQMISQMQQALGSMPQISTSSSHEVPVMNFRRSPNSLLQIRSPMQICNGEPPVPVEAPQALQGLLANSLLDAATPEPKQASTPPVAQAAVEEPSKVDEITQAVLDNMNAVKGSKAKAKAKEKAKAKGSKGTPKAKAKVLKEATKKVAAAAAEKDPPMPKLGPMTAITFLTCSIYADNKSRVWRVIEKSNRRKDYKISWNGGKVAWAKVLDKCRELSS